MQEAHSANMHGWLQHGSSCSLATHLKLTIDIDKVIAGCWTGCWSAMSSSEAVVDGAVKSRPEDRSSKWSVLEILRIDGITTSGEA